MKFSISKKIKRLLKVFGVSIIRTNTLENFVSDSCKARDLTAILSLGDSESVSMWRDLLKKSRAQLRQDLYVLKSVNFKKNGYFVEFGATDGINLSNTYLLEKEYGWNGILVEPAIIWQKDLAINRTCEIDTRCVWSESGLNINFTEVSIPELSTVNLYVDHDYHGQMRKGGTIYSVGTVSLIDLLDEHKAPRNIDYLSVDTEGTEFEILRTFDFSKYSFSCITVEHNYSSTRQAIFDLLTVHGYKRVYVNLSFFDDWYIRE